MSLFLWDRPSTIFEQHFGHGLDPEDLVDLHAWLAPTPSKNYHQRLWRAPLARHRRDAGSKISLGKDAFKVCLDVQQFSPDEITVKTVGDQVVIEGKHEEKPDEHGHISRHFVRKYQLPEGYKAEDVVSSLSSDGVLSINVPKTQPQAVEGERVIPIMMTGPAHTAIKDTTKPDQPVNGEKK